MMFPEVDNISVNSYEHHVAFQNPSSQFMGHNVSQNYSKDLLLVITVIVRILFSLKYKSIARRAIQLTPYFRQLHMNAAEVINVMKLRKSNHDDNVSEYSSNFVVDSLFEYISNAAIIQRFLKLCIGSHPVRIFSFGTMPFDMETYITSFNLQ